MDKRPNAFGFQGIHDFITIGNTHRKGLEHMGTPLFDDGRDHSF